VITRTGRYKRFPIAGTAIAALGMLLLSRLDSGTSTLYATVSMLVMGLGLGLVMQVLVLAVQNAVDYAELGVATSGATLFRSVGGSVGTAILGSIFSSRLKSQLATRLAATHLPRAQVDKLASAAGNPASLKRLPAPVHHAYVSAFTNSLDRVFVVAACVAGAAFLLSWLLEQRPLRDTVTASTGIGESFAVPKPADSMAEMARALTVLVGREGRRRLVEQLAARAGVDASPACAWLLARMSLDRELDLAAAAAAYDVPIEAARRGRAEAIDRGYLNVDDGGLTPLGEAAAAKLIAERRASLERLCEGWSPDQHAGLATLLTRLAEELTGTLAREAAAIR
jgi:hypothetical protein